MVAQPDTNVNYIRNSVKAVVDAYDGTVKLYAWDETDPGAADLGEGLPRHGAAEERDLRRPAEHLRYPQDMFKVQRRSWPATT